MSHSDPTVPQRSKFPYFRFNLLSLLILTTICCLIAAWWFYPRPTEIVSLVYARNFGASISTIESRDESKSALSEEMEMRRTRLTELAEKDSVIQRALRTQEALSAAKTLTGGEDNLESWLKDRIDIDFPNGSEIMRWSLTVDKKHVAEGCRVLDGLVSAFVGEWNHKYATETLDRTEELVRYQSQLTERADTLLEAIQRNRDSEAEKQVMQREAVRLIEEAGKIGLQIQAVQAVQGTGDLQIIQPATAKQN
jgi:hypothetical protein